MPSHSEIAIIIAGKLSRLASPNHDPMEETELTGSVPESLVTRSEGSGLARTRFGPRYAYYWHEAQKLAIAVEVALQLRELGS